MVLNSIIGKLTEKHHFACCEVNGIEWQLAMSEQSLASLPAVGTQVRIYTCLKVSENSIALYGFTTKDERILFEALISVSGVGPKLAMAMLSKTKVEELAHYIIQGDTKQLARLPGMGSKTAQKLILQLRDTLAKRLLLGRAQSNQADIKEPTNENKVVEAMQLPEYLQQHREYEELLSALLAMGYEERYCREVLNKLCLEWGEDVPQEGERLRQAIVHLS